MPNEMTEQEPKRGPTIRERLEGPEMVATLAQVLPKHLKPDRMVRVAIAALTRTPKLRDCDQVSFFNCLMTLSQWGLEPDGRHAHLIPFRNNRVNKTECQLIIDYKGLVELAYRSGSVKSIHADVVCENDEFKYDRGELVQHEINFRKPRGAVYAVYCRVMLKGDVEKCEVMARDEVEAVRKRSKSGNNGPWVTDWNAMALKTVFRRCSKWIPLSADIREAFHGDDDVIDGSFTQQPRIDSGDAIPVEDMDSLAQVLQGESPPRIEVSPDAPRYERVLSSCATEAELDEALMELEINEDEKLQPEIKEYARKLRHTFSAEVDESKDIF